MEARGGAAAYPPSPRERGGRRLLREKRAVCSGRYGGGGSSGREKVPGPAPLSPAVEPWLRAGSLGLLSREAEVGPWKS